MRGSILAALGSVVMATAGVSAAAQAPAAKPAAPPAKAPAASPESVSDERGLLLEILKELRGMRSDLRNLQRPPVPAMPTPPPLPSSIKLGSGRALGRPEAKVAIIEFSEFQCPFCKRYHDQTFAQLKEAYVDSGRVLYEFRDYPLVAMHPQARSAALAARCAGEQGAYWKMQDELFEAQSSLGPELYPRLASSLGLDGERFQKCLVDPAQEKALAQEIAAAEMLGVRGTPHFFVGQVKDGSIVSVRALSGAQPVQSFRATLDAMLALPSGANAPPALDGAIR